MLSESFDDLVSNLKKFPGIGEKTATRLALHLLKLPKDEARKIGESMITAVNSFDHCPICNILTDEKPCTFCKDEMRSESLLCVVESTQDVFLVENTHEYKGKYFVLGNLLSPMDGIGPAEIHFPLLIHYLNDHKVEELILALSPSVEGETTINFIVEQLKDKVNNITRLSTGLPFGGDMEYATSKTLATALQRRYSVED